MKHLTVTVNGVAYDVTVEETAGGAVAPKTPAPAPAAAAPAPAAPAAAGGEPVKSPMPGNILDVRVSAGQAVKKGDVLLILEAMKMENEILAARDGVVASVAVTKGATVNSGDVMLTLN